MSVRCHRHAFIGDSGCPVCRIAGLEAELAEARNERDIAQANSADRERLLRERDAAQAEAAVLRDAASDLLSHIIVYLPPVAGGLFDMLCRALNAAVAGHAGRDLAARLPLWRELQELSANVEANCDWIVKSGHAEDEHDPECTACAIDAVLSKLAALDAAQPTSKGDDDE